MINFVRTDGIGSDSETRGCHAVDMIDGCTIHWEIFKSDLAEWEVAALVENGEGEFAVYQDNGDSCGEGAYRDGWFDELEWSRDMETLRAECMMAASWLTREEFSAQQKKIRRIISDLSDG